MPLAIHLHPLGGETEAPLNLVVETKRLPVLAALATMPVMAFSVLIARLAQNPIDPATVSENEGIGLSAFYGTVTEYFDE